MTATYRLTSTTDPLIDTEAPVSVRTSIEINAPIERVWSILTDLPRWTEWNSAVTAIEASGPVAVGTTFRWRAGSTINSQVFRVTAPTLIAWSGRTMGIDAVHVWRLSSGRAGTIVTTEESFQSLLVRLFPGTFHGMLTKSLETVLGDLKRAAES